MCSSETPSSGLLLVFHLDFFLCLSWPRAAHFGSYSCCFYSLRGFILEGGFVRFILRVHGALMTRPLQNSPLPCRRLLAGVWKLLPVSAMVPKWFSKLPVNTCLLVLETAASVGCPIAFLCFLQHSVDTIQVLVFWQFVPTYSYLGFMKTFCQLAFL